MRCRQIQFSGECGNEGIAKDSTLEAAKCRNLRCCLCHTANCIDRILDGRLVDHPNLSVERLEIWSRIGQLLREIKQVTSADDRCKTIQEFRSGKYQHGFAKRYHVTEYAILQAIDPLEEDGCVRPELLKVFTEFRKERISLTNYIGNTFLNTPDKGSESSTDVFHEFDVAVHDLLDDFVLAKEGLECTKQSAQCRDNRHNHTNALKCAETHIAKGCRNSHRYTHGSYNGTKGQSGSQHFVRIADILEDGQGSTKNQSSSGRKPGSDDGILTPCLGNAQHLKNSNKSRCRCENIKDDLFATCIAKPDSK